MLIDVFQMTLSSTLEVRDRPQWLHSAEEVWAPRSGATSEGDVMSIDGDGISTPGTWTEVGSVVSENDIGSGEHH